jgi:hypothetical protein
MFQAIVHITRTMLQVIGWFALLVVVLMLSILGPTFMALFLDWPLQQLILVAFIFWAIYFAYHFWGPGQTGCPRRSSIGSSHSSGSGAAAGFRVVGLVVVVAVGVGRALIESRHLHC